MRQFPPATRSEKGGWHKNTAKPIFLRICVCPCVCQSKCLGNEYQLCSYTPFGNKERSLTPIYFLLGHSLDVRTSSVRPYVDGLSFGLLLRPSFVRLTMKSRLEYDGGIRCAIGENDENSWTGKLRDRNMEDTNTTIKYYIH